MFGIMFRKLISKWWMNLCLLLGCTLFIATAVSFPLYQNAAYDRMLHDEFQNYLTDKGTWPAINRLSMTSQRERNGEDIRDLEELVVTLNRELGVMVKQNVSYFLMTAKDAVSEMNRSDLGKISMRLGMLSDLPAHAKMISGEMYSESGLSEDGAIEAVISQNTFVGLNLLVGETLVVDTLKDEAGNPVRFVIRGVFEADDESDFYWQFKPDNMKNVLLVNETLFHDRLLGEEANKNIFVCIMYSLFEYAGIEASHAEEMLEKAVYYTKDSDFKKIISGGAYLTLLENYVARQERIHTTLTILQIPVLVMLAAFLLMISGQMYDMERNEISVIKSRGSSGRQIFRLYLYQSILLALAGGASGIPLGELFSRILGSARNFLEFDSSQYLETRFSTEVWIYAFAAMGLTLLVMAIPAIKYSKTTIVKLKQQKAVRKKSFWEKIYLDVILLGISLYGYYSFHRNMASMTEDVLRGKTLDPLLYISSSLFILGLGLLFLRIQPWFVQLIYLIGKKFWKPASYVSFRESVKNGKKQQFIMLFLIMTISLGMYHAIVARTILQNAVNNTEYLDNADIILKEVWKEILDDEGEPTGNFYEPDYERYLNMEGAESCTRVWYSDNLNVGTGKKRVTIALMGIHTKEFGEMTWVDREYNGKHFYELLNELAMNENGVLVSENFRTLWGYEAGDFLVYSTPSGKSMTAQIVDFFSYWPGYSPSSVVTFEDGTIYNRDNYLVVTHYDLLQQRWSTDSYEVWIDLKDGYGSDYMYDFIQQNKISVSKYVDKQADIEAAVANPLLQGTNGVLTMGFIVTLLLCVVGYLIYWIMSIRSRELIFGVLRACGMHRGELFHMLMNEQIFCGLFPVLAGIGIGKLTSKMFVPMLQQAYAAADQVLPMKMITENADMVKLYAVIAAAIVLCLFVLILLLMKLNVSKALKLGEE